MICRSSRGRRIHWLSRSKLSLADKGGGKILVSTDVPRMGRQSLPVHKGGEDTDPTIAVAKANHSDFASFAKLVGISFLAPPNPWSITGRLLPLTIRCAWNMPSAGSTSREAFPGRASKEGRIPVQNMPEPTGVNVPSDQFIVRSRHIHFLMCLGIYKRPHRFGAQDCLA